MGMNENVGSRCTVLAAARPRIQSSYQRLHPQFPQASWPDRSGAASRFRRAVSRRGRLTEEPQVADFEMFENAAGNGPEAVPGSGEQAWFHSRAWRSNTVPATVSNSVSSGQCGASPPCRIAASIPAAEARASPGLMVPTSPTIFQIRSPRCWHWTKNRFLPVSSTRTPKPRSSASRMSRVVLRGFSASTRAAVRVILGMCFSRFRLQPGKRSVPRLQVFGTKKRRYVR